MLRGRSLLTPTWHGVRSVSGLISRLGTSTIIRLFASAAFLIVVVFAAGSSSKPANATTYWILSPDWYLSDVNGSNYAYHKLYVQWDGWYSGYSSDYSEMKTTVTSPLTSYGSWNAERIDGPYFGGGYVTLSYSGGSSVSLYTNNPQYVSISWGYGLNTRSVRMSICPSQWCGSSGLSYWGAYITGNYSTNGTTGYFSAHAH